MDIGDPNPNTPEHVGKTRLHPSDHLMAEPAVEQDDPPSPGRSATRVRGKAWRQRRRPWKNTRRAKPWRETCRPGCGLSGNLLPTGLVIFGGLFFLILLFAGGSMSDSAPAPNPLPATHRTPPCPRSADVLLGRVAGPGIEDENALVSEAEDDNNASMAAGAWQLDTDHKLSQIDMLRVWNLNNRWRPPLNEFQDSLIGLAGLATRGGSWVSHEMCRNDLTLESELIAPHALALSEGEPDDDLTAGVSTPQHEARVAQWEALWRKIEKSADEQVRSSEDLENFWKSGLDETLKHVRRAHQALLPLICDLADESAAQAVIRYFDRYFSDNFPASITEGQEQE